MKLLAIDDIPMNLHIYKGIISKNLPDSIYKDCTDPAEGIRIAKEWQPDVIMLDYHMPLMDGTQVIRQLKADHTTEFIPIILLTAEKTTSEIRTAGLENGADAFIQKPVSSLELVAQIKVMNRIRQAELKLREEQKALKALLVERSKELNEFKEVIIPMLDNFPAMIWRSTLGVHCDWFNHTWLEFRGRTMEEEIGQGWSEGIHPEDLQGLIDINVAAYKDQKPFVITCRILKHDGTWRTIRSHGSPLYGPNRAFAGFLGACYDITDQIAIEEQLRHSQKMESIGILAAGVAHDFNNILTVILGYASMLHLQLPQDSTHSEAAGMIVDASKRASELVKQLLTFSRKQKEGRKTQDICQLARNFKPFLEQALGNNVNLAMNDDKIAVYVAVDKTMFEQILMNLAINARDAMPDGGDLQISIKPYSLTQQEASMFEINAGEYAKISFKDTGPGISSEIRERVFDPFFTTKELGKGTGLGLSIVYSIARQHGGAVTIENNDEKGAAISVILPQGKVSDDKQ